MVRSAFAFSLVLGLAQAGRAETWHAAALRPVAITAAEDGQGVTRFTAVVDRAALLAELPVLQDHGAVSAAISADEAAGKPAAYTNVLSLLLMTYAVQDAYAAQPGLGASTWRVELSPTPADPVRREMYSFSFDRGLFDRTAWDRLPFTEFPRVAPGFSYNLRFTLDLTHELGGGITED